MLRKKARALSLANAAARMALVKKEAERITKENALLTDYGLAASLERAPSSGVDALSRRPEGTETGGAALLQQERDKLFRAAKRFGNATKKKRAKKRSAGAVTAPKPEPAAEGLPGRTVTVRKL